MTNETKAARIADALRCWRNPNFYQDFATPQTQKDGKSINANYQANKSTMTFGESSRKAEIDFVLMVFKTP